MSGVWGPEFDPLAGSGFSDYDWIDHGQSFLNSGKWWSQFSEKFDGSHVAKLEAGHFDSQATCSAAVGYDHPGPHAVWSSARDPVLAPDHAEKTGEGQVVFES